MSALLLSPSNKSSERILFQIVLWGVLICWDCIIAERRTLIIGTNVKKLIQQGSSKEEELEFMSALFDVPRSQEMIKSF